MGFSAAGYLIDKPHQFRYQKDFASEQVAIKRSECYEHLRLLTPTRQRRFFASATISTEKTTLTALPLDPMTDTAPTKTVPDVQSDASKNNTSSKTLNKNVMVVAAVAGVAVASVAVTAAVASTTTTATATTAIG